MIRPLLVLGYFMGVMGVMGCQQAGASAPIAKARPGDAAILEELVAARAAGTVEAYRLFIRRHPQHRLADLARKELGDLERRHRR